VPGTDWPPGIVVAVKRRSPITLLLLAAATLTAGCTTFSDNDLAARVDDVEYSRDDLVADLEDLGKTDEQLATGDIARSQVGAWIAERVGEASDPTLAEAAYAKGLFESGSICLEVVATSAQADADAVVLALEDGTNFADVFAASNVDDALAQSDGRIGCLAYAELALGGDNPLVESIIAINANDPYATAVLPGATPGEDLYVVSRFIPYDELGPGETPVVIAALNADALDLDIYVDPQIGTYDSASATVIPLG
jgi:hypothetical protein